jgi:hypothetical protein
MNLTITADTTVRDLLSAHPELFSILERHGMCPDCKDDPPPVPLHHFATKHCGGDVDGLIRELHGVAGPSSA